MGIRELGFSLILFILLLHSVSPSPVQKNLPSASELMQRSKVEEKRHIYGGSKIEGGGTSHGSGGGGKAPNNGENGNTQQGGGAAVIPVYAAGSASHRQNHHGAATSNLKTLQLPTLIMMILAVFTLV
ncbi:hypothetical protein QN277_011282 [Acacia crassicarpa]|uniref:Uncharacterized protein n=1 Tax=Acacia crassicarpa TaxID=499986 RepID=A0AAE1MYA2_9FABA|nr:hypothetical protein QN277_011282 [Acacia crassicarpa]